jgi:hypothetical protein
MKAVAPTVTLRDSNQSMRLIDPLPKRLRGTADANGKGAGVEPDEQKL